MSYSPRRLRGVSDVLRAAGEERGLHLNPASQTGCRCSTTSHNCLSAPPTTTVIPAEAVAFVSFVFLPLSLSGSCNETCHLEMTPSPPPRDVFMPPQLLADSFIQQPLLRACSVLVLS